MAATDDILPGLPRLVGKHFDARGEPRLPGCGATATDDQRPCGAQPLNAQRRCSFEAEAAARRAMPAECRKALPSGVGEKCPVSTMAALRSTSDGTAHSMRSTSPRRPLRFRPEGEESATGRRCCLSSTATVADAPAARASAPAAERQSPPALLPVVRCERVAFDRGHARIRARAGGGSDSRSPVTPARIPPPDGAPFNSRNWRTVGSR
jgi:hypothetical protein